MNKPRFLVFSSIPTVLITVFSFLWLTISPASAAITMRVSLSNSQSEGSAASSHPSVSSSSILTTFTSLAPLTAENQACVFVRDLDAETTTFIAQGFSPVISGDGNFITYLVHDDNTHLDDLFILPRDGSSPPLQVNQGLSGDICQHPALSHNGRYIVFSANNALGGITDIYFLDRINLTRTSH